MCHVYSYGHGLTAIILTHYGKQSSVCVRVMVKVVCHFQIYSGTMRLTIVPPSVRKRWSSKQRREGENGGKQRRRRVENCY